MSREDDENFSIRLYVQKQITEVPEAYDIFAICFFSVYRIGKAEIFSLLVKHSFQENLFEQFEIGY